MASKATLKFEGVIEVRNGDVIILGTDYYGVSIKTNGIVDLRKIVLDLRTDDRERQCPAYCFMRDDGSCWCIRDQSVPGGVTSKTSIGAQTDVRTRTNVTPTTGARTSVVPRTSTTTVPRTAVTPTTTTPRTSLFTRIRSLLS